MANSALEIAKVIYENLRNEILEKMRFSNQLAAYKLISIGALLSFIASRPDNVSKFFLIAPTILGNGLAISFDLALFHNNQAIIKVGKYMRENIEPLFRTFTNEAQLVPPTKMWEEFIASEEQRGIYNNFEAVNYYMTLLIMLMSIFYLWSINRWTTLALFILLAGEGRIIYMGLHKR